MKYLVLFVCLVGVSSARKLPSSINVCNPSKSDVSTCLKENIIALQPKLKDGIPEMAVPSFGPLVVPLAEIKAGDFQATMKDLKVWGVDKFDIQQLKLTLEPEITLIVSAKFDHINVLTDYTMNGKLLVLKLDGSGPGQINITDLVADLKIFGKRETKNGKEHIVLTTVDAKPTVGHLSIFFQDLFKGNPELTDNANKVLNDNQAVIVEEFTPVVTQILKEFLFGIVNNIFSHYTFDELFPKA